jgi:hypothetical protein
MNSPEWRSFASREMAEIETDVDLAAQPVQDGSTNRLLGTTDRGSDIGEGLPANGYFRRSSATVSPSSSEATETPRAGSRENTRNHALEELSIRDTHEAKRAVTSKCWKGNPIFASTWEILGVVVSICFLSTLFSKAPMLGYANSFTSLRSFCCTFGWSGTKPVVTTYHPGDQDRALSMAYTFLGYTGERGPRVGGLAGGTWRGPFSMTFSLGKSKSALILGR